MAELNAERTRANLELLRELISTNDDAVVRGGCETLRRIESLDRKRLETALWYALTFIDETVLVQMIEHFTLAEQVLEDIDAL